MQHARTLSPSATPRGAAAAPTRLLEIVFAVTLLACDHPESRACVPGAAVACVGPGGCAGGQVCDDDGSAYGPCDCGDVDSGVPVVDAGSDAGASLPDAGATEDADPPDAPSGPCDPVAQTGCPSGQRCTWIRVGLEGRLACVPPGRLGLHDACSTTEGAPDDCAGGLICVANSCERACSLADGCTADHRCVRYDGVFDEEEIGVCDPTCDPVRQTRDYDGAAACGSPDPASPTRGCYGPLHGPFTCAPVTWPERTHRAPLSGPVYVNSCAPGYLPMRGSTGASAPLVCLALCDPAPSWMGNASLRQGTPPHTCAARGATASTEECLFADTLSGMPIDGAEVGVCLDTSLYTFDHDLDPSTPDAPWPSCADLSMSDDDLDGIPDYLEHACGPLP